MAAGQLVPQYYGKTSIHVLQHRIGLCAENPQPIQRTGLMLVWTISSWKKPQSFLQPSESEQKICLISVTDDHDLC